VPEHIFKNYKEYLLFDHEDSWGFFIQELNKFGRIIERVDPGNVDYRSKFVEIIKQLFEVYEALIIDIDEQTLWGSIGKNRYLIKKLET
jgi:hypothetical protein